MVLLEAKNILEVTRMVNQATLDKLHSMRLTAMADSFSDQAGDDAYKALSFEERFGMIVDSEWGKRRTSKLQKLIGAAAFRFPNACIEDIEYHADRKLNKAEMLQLSTCRYIQEGHHIILKGAAGNGKSYIGCAFGIAACRNFLSVRYVRLPELLNDLVVARGEGTLKKLIKTYQKVDLLILDEWLLQPLTTGQAMDLFEIMEVRTRQGAVIFCTQFDPEGWYERIGTVDDVTVSEAIIDRFKYDSYEILIEGDVSMRERHGLKSKNPRGVE